MYNEILRMRALFARANGGQKRRGNAKFVVCLTMQTNLSYNK